MEGQVLIASSALQQQQEVLSESFDPALQDINFIPIGVNADLAVGFKCPPRDWYIIEQIQMAQVIVSTLKRCTFRRQYEEIMKRFLKLLKRDPGLHEALAIVLRSTKLIEFRDSLPEEGGGPLKSEPAQREEFEHILEIRAEEEEHQTPAHQEAVSVFLYVIRSKGIWKETRLNVKCMPDTVPAAYLSETSNEVTVASYCGPNHLIQVNHFNLDTYKPICDPWYIKGKGGGPLCVTRGGFVSDSHAVYGLRGTRKHTLENLVITAIHWSPKTGLLIGSSAGHVFSVERNECQVVRDSVAIFALHSSSDGRIIAQTINDVNLLNQEDTLLNVGRPVASLVTPRRVVFVTKYDMIISWFGPSTNSMIEEKSKGAQGGGFMGHIWLSPDETELAVLFPNGRLTRKKLSKPGQ